MRSSFPAVARAILVLRVFCTSRCVPFVVLVGRPAARSASWQWRTSISACPNPPAPLREGQGRLKRQNASKRSLKALIGF